MPLRRPIVQLDPREQRRLAADVVAQLKKPHGHLWKVFMGVPNKAKLPLEAWILARIKGKLDDYHWSIRTFRFGAQVEIVVWGVGKQRDWAFGPEVFSFRLY